MKVLVKSNNEIRQFLTRLASFDGPLSFDTETEGLFFKDDDTVGFSVAFSEDEGYYFPLKHDNSVIVPHNIAERILTLLAKRKLIFHNACFDIETVYQHFGIKLPIYFDTYVAAVLLGYEKCGLKPLVSEIFEFETREFQDMLEESFGKQWKARKLCSSNLTAASMYEYAVDDVLYTYKLFNKFFEPTRAFSSIFKVEMNLIPVFACLNMQGILIDKAPLVSMLESAKERHASLFSKLQELAKHSFEPNSNRQVNKILFEELRLPVLKRSRVTQQPSADAEVLEQLSYQHEFPKALLEYRSINKFISGYLEKIPSVLDAESKMYASFSQLGTDSGRVACPGVKNHLQEDCTLNLQNQPGDDVFPIRSAYVAPEGFTFVKADYSMIEYRVMANLAGESSVIDKFNKGIDFHTATYRFMHGLPDDVEVTKAQRAQGKVINFAISYGMGLKSLAQRLEISEKEAETLYNKYFEALPKIKALINWCTKKVYEKRCSTTLFGRRRILDYTKLPQRLVGDFVRRGFNSTCQGTAADILKIGMLRLKSSVLDKYPDDVKLVLTVHDELDFYVRTEKLEVLLPLIKNAMEVPVPSNFTNFRVDIEYGPNWSELSHVDWEPPETYKGDPFTSWKEVLPQEYSSLYEDPEYVVTW